MKNTVLNLKTEKVESKSKKFAWLCFDDHKKNFATKIESETTYEEAEKFFMNSIHDEDKCIYVRVLTEVNTQLIETIINFFKSVTITDWRFKMLYVKNNLIHCNNGQTQLKFNLSDLINDKLQMKIMNNKIISIDYLYNLLGAEAIEITEHGVAILKNKEITLNSFFYGKIGKNKEIFSVGQCSGKKEYEGQVPMNLQGDKIVVY